MNNEYMKCFEIQLKDKDGNVYFHRICTTDWDPQHIAEHSKKTFLEGKHLNVTPLIETLREVDAI